MKQVLPVLNRRRTLALLGAVGTQALWGQLAGNGALDIPCVPASPAATEGPYFVDEMLNRSDIRVDPSNGAVSAGVPLALTIRVVEIAGSGCVPLAGAQVDIWHCDGGGLYSDESANNTAGRKFLRGYQLSDDNGEVRFTTIYPGWYTGRAVHIHFKIRTYSNGQRYDEFTSQFFFDESLTDVVHAQAPYNTRRTRDTLNSTDNIYRGMANASSMILNCVRSGDGYAAAISVGVSLRTVTAKPAVAANGVVNAAGYQAGIAPGAWISIFGQNLAAVTRTVTASDLVDGSLPTNLAGVSVQINDQAAFMHYISPTQINVQAPADAGEGSVSVAVSNAGGVSDAVRATRQSILPAFFAAQNYVAAVRAGGTIITAATPAKPGDVLQIFGNGFGPSIPAVAPGRVFQGAYPLTNAVAITIGRQSVPASFAGLVAAGLYQFNVVVPSLADGDHEVVAQIAGQRTPSGVLLKVQA
jgi:uncharacterized protein (TIGR03437 family)